ncbi:hypothetical protein ElyMa_003480900 [Elysia marginata]|uniref:Uncharacterized protein n=1 Tax=Elysia marginata TaxID=1093978 RepID=A0AAV4ECI6_9GAST|nr:hypothetical protein ElyMa_003480900 [Elysia marginata]
MDGIRNSVFKDRYIIELVFSFQLFEISIRFFKSTLWTAEKRYNKERVHFKDWSIVFSQMCRICFINTIDTLLQLGLIQSDPSGVEVYRTAMDAL